MVTATTNLTSTDFDHINTYIREHVEWLSTRARAMRCLETEISVVKFDADDPDWVKISIVFKLERVPVPDLSGWMPSKDGWVPGRQVGWKIPPGRFSEEIRTTWLQRGVGILG